MTYEERKLAGLCVYCGLVPPEPHRIGCANCGQRRYTTRQERLKRSGKCDSCPNSAMLGRRYCQECNNAKNQRRIRLRQENQSKVNAYKLEKGCIECGYKEHPVALDFDHLPGFTKVRDIAAMTRNFSWVKILEEINKCEIVCANHHRIRTETRRLQAEEVFDETKNTN